MQMGKFPKPCKKEKKLHSVPQMLVAWTSSAFHTPVQPLHSAADWAGAVGLLLFVKREAENKNSCADGHDFSGCEVYCLLWRFS